MSKSAYCTNCDREVEVKLTVPWQDDLCKNCGNSIPTDSIETSRGP